MVAWNEIGDGETQSTGIGTNLPFMGRRMFSRYLTPFPAPLRQQVAEGKASGECVAGKRRHFCYWAGSLTEAPGRQTA